MTPSEALVLAVTVVGTGIVWACDAYVPKNDLKSKVCTKISLVICVTSLVLHVISIVK